MASDRKDTRRISAISEVRKIDMIEIREMDDGYILDRCPLYAPLDPFHLTEDEYLPQVYGEGAKQIRRIFFRQKEIRRKFFREVRAKYGNCVLFAWDHEKIVGFLIFLPKLVARKLALKTSPEDELIDKTLIYVCMQIVSQYRNKGIGTKMVNALITWARQNGWKRIEVHMVGNDTGEAEAWRWKWALPKWERMGFRITRKYEIKLPKKKAQFFSGVLDINNGREKMQRGKADGE